MHLLSLSKIALFIAAASQSVFADEHSWCYCSNGDSWNVRITEAACKLYTTKGYRNSNVAFVPNAGRCDAKSGSYLMGKEWEAACRSVAASGFPCADGQGTCYASTALVRGRC